MKCRAKVSSAPNLRERGEAFIDSLARAEPYDAPVTLVVAHPDDEAIGAGGQLYRLRNLTIIVASDGASANSRDMAHSRHASLADYAKTRRRELEKAVSSLSLSEHGLICLDLPDGEIFMATQVLVAILAQSFEMSGSRIVLTHAFEGGHPDHDALALAVQLAADKCPDPPAIVEMPFYHAGPKGWVFQTFIESEPPATRIRLDDASFARKCAMLDAHESQSDNLQPFRQPVETFRTLRAHDLSELPNDGRLLYSDVAPHVSRWEWLAYARAACLREAD